MPTSVVAAVIASEVASAVVIPFAMSSVFVQAAVYYGTQFAVSSMVSNTLSSALYGSPQAAQQPAAQAAQARMTMLRVPAAPRQIIYGEVMVSGAMVFAASSTDNSTLHFVLAVAGHEVESISGFYLNDKAVGALDVNGVPTGGDFASNAVFKVHLGSTTQAADADLIAAGVGWTSAHRLQGIAYVYVKLTYAQSVFPTGIPNIRCVVQGKKLYDPRTALTVYSNNSALVAYDYIRTYLQASTTEMDSANWIAQANICDEAVTLAAGGTESRYTANGVITTTSRHRDAMKTILSSCGGIVTCPQGLYRLNVAAYAAPVITFNEDILRAPIKVRAAVSKKSLYNAVKGQFINPANFWQGADFPALTNALYAAQDGEQIFADIQLPFTTSATMAQRLARIALEKSRQGISVELPSKASALQVLPFENLSLNISHLGWSNKIFKTMTAKLNENGSVDLTLQEEASACYDWSAYETTYDLAPNTNLPNPFTVGIPGNVQMVEVLYETTQSAGVKAKAILTWTAPADAFVVDYEVEYKLSSSGTWLEVFNVRGTQYDFYDLTPALYDFRVKARNIMGVVSDYTPPKHFQVYGLTAAPASVAGFTVKPMSGMGLANWNRTTDLDVKIGGDVVIKWSPLTTGATWADGVILPDGEYNGDATSATVPLATGTYMAKFKDSTGHYSDTAASFVATEAIVSGWTTVATSTQHPTFTGAKTGVFFSSTAPAIELDGTTLIDDWGLIDDQSFIDSIGGIIPSGTYEFDAVMDCSSIAARRFHAHIKAQAYLANDYIDDHLNLIDTWADIDGVGLEDETATVWGAASTDGITYQAWAPFLVADFYGRYFKFKTILTSNDVTHNIHVYELSVTAKIPT